MKKTNIIDTDIIMVNYSYNDISIDEKLLDEDAKIVREILNHRILYRDNPSCGFSEEISIKLNSGDRIFCMSLDDCPVFKDVSSGKYFSISEKKYIKFCEVMEKYGVTFPAL